MSADGRRLLSEREQEAKELAGVQIAAEARRALAGLGFDEAKIDEMIAELALSGRRCGETVLRNRATADPRVRRGAICRCRAGLLGLVLSEEPLPISYRDGTGGIAWTGVALESGLPWSSSQPEFVADGNEALDEIQDVLWRVQRETRLARGDR